MRYAIGIIVGAVLPLIIFFGAAMIKVAGIPWDIYVIWFVISIGIAVVPPIVVYSGKRELFREFVIYEGGGFGVFTPIWMILFTDLAGESWTTLFTIGITDGLIAPGLGGTIVGIDVSNFFLIPFFIFSLIAGLFVLRPSFVQRYGLGEMPELKVLKDDTTPPEDPIEAEMPDVAPPEASAETIADLKTHLVELGVAEPTINQILESGISTTTDFVATSADHLVTLTGLDKRT
ncbi:MAG: hypothetical protein ACXAAO_15640, partial [Candidatus Thorarchaeota archaeon]